MAKQLVLMTSLNLLIIKLSTEIEGIISDSSDCCLEAISPLSLGAI